MFADFLTAFRALALVLVGLGALGLFSAVAVHVLEALEGKK